MKRVGHSGVRTLAAWLGGQRQQKLLVFIVLAFGVAGSILLSAGHAATSAVDIRAANGAVVAPADIVGDTLASGGSAVKFGATDPSGIPLPASDGAGWTRIFNEDFTTPSSLGDGFPSTAYAAKWHTYGVVTDNSHQVYYDNPKSVSVANGMLDMYMHTENGEHICAEMYPKLTSTTIAQIYGRYSVRYRVDPTAGYGGVWLLFPSDHVWPAHGEIDYPEGSFTGQMQAHAHYADANGGQSNFTTGSLYGAWHTATIEWSPDKEVFLFDGQVIGTSTHEVPSTPMFYSFQCGSSTDSSTPPPDASSGHMQIDWVTIDSYTP